MVGRTGRAGVHSADDLPGLLPSHDVVVLLVPLTPQTVRMVGAEFLAAMPDGSVLVNASRGAVVETSALVAELCSGRLRAVLDVVDPDPASWARTVEDARSTDHSPCRGHWHRGQLARAGLRRRPRPTGVRRTRSAPAESRRPRLLARVSGRPSDRRVKWPPRALVPRPSILRRLVRVCTRARARRRTSKQACWPGGEQDRKLSADLTVAVSTRDEGRREHPAG
jgi:hypothetical protein